MYKRIKLMAFALMASMAVANAQTTAPAWPQLKTFHSYMAATFHPAEEGNFGPLKSKADSLLIAAKLWQASPIPSNYKTEETHAALKKLVKQCESVNKAVIKKSPDEELKKEITEAHEIFHHIVGECKKEVE